MLSFKKRKHLMISYEKTFRVPEGITLQAIHEVLSGLDCPRALAVWIIIRDDPLQLKSLGFDPLHYRDMVGCRDAYLATKIVSKSSFFKVDNDPVKMAMDKFWKCELVCKQTNTRFKDLSSDPLYNGQNVWLYNTFKRKIERILGRFSPDELFDEANWGPGVTTLLKGLAASATNKFQCEIGITRDLHALIQPLMLEGYPLWGAHLNTIGFPKFDVGNRVVTVPKDAFIDRVIAVEPGLNLWFQKGIGKMIRTRLMGHGVDLNKQSYNQRYAQQGSVTSKLATVDFSSASDTISRELVMDVLPDPWRAIMNMGRSHYGLVDAKPVKWEKFSSMGNGFTFELESLIFFAAALAVCEYLKLDASEVSVYGDDVIIPSDAFAIYSSFCTFLGFSINIDKTYVGSNPFRESCGMHYYDGVDITPIFIKKVARRLGELYRQLNALRRLAYTRGGNLYCDATIKPAWLLLYREVPRNLRIFGPYGKGDGFILGNMDEACPVRARDGIEGYYFEQFIDVGITRPSSEIGLLLNRLRNVSTKELNESYALRGLTRVSYKTKTLVWQWRDLGLWF